MDLEARLRRLERMVQCFILLLFISIILIAVRFCRVATFESLRVQRLEIVDGKGHALIVLSRNPFGQPIFTMQDINGRKRFGVSLDADGNALVAVFDEKGQIAEKIGR